MGLQRVCSRKRIALGPITILMVCLLASGGISSSAGPPLGSFPCRGCRTSHGANRTREDSFVANMIDTVSEFCEKYVFVNSTERDLARVLENAIDAAASKDKYEILDGIQIEATSGEKAGRALFSSYTYEYRLLKKVKDFVDTHVLSINLPKAAGLVGLRSFGLKKLFLPLLIGLQVFKSILLAMFLPSILGSFGKILGKGISHLSATSSQASYPPANGEEPSYESPEAYMGYETQPAGQLAALETDAGSQDDMSRFGDHKVSYLPTKNGYYKNQMANNYKVFQKIPASSMILSNYDPFYSPLLSRLDGIFARLGLAPSEGTADDGQGLSAAKLEACREQLVCLMYASPAKYAPYSNLVSAQLSRELNELRRPASDNAEILRFFRYMRAARKGQEGADCLQLTSGCAVSAPAHTMLAAYHDLNKLVTARRLAL